MRFSLSRNGYRFFGISTLFLLVYIVVIGIFGNVDISAWLPIKLATSLQEAWPRMPFFTVQQQAGPDGQGQVIYYTVPTRQITPQELARMKVPPLPTKPSPASQATSAPAVQ